MSDNSEVENNVLEDSPQSSPENAIGSSSDAQSHQSNSSAFENVSDHSNPGPSRFSPPSSPVRRGRKRPTYGDYKDDPTIPVPRQTLHSRKRKRAESHSSQSSSDDSSDSEKRTTPKRGDNEEEIFTTGDSHQIYCQEENLDHTGNMSQSSLESSEIGEDDSGSELSFNNNSNSNHSNSSYSNCSNSDVNDENNGSDSEIEGSENDPFDDDSLYPGCQKTKDEAIYEMINVYLCKKLSKSAFKDILKIYVTSLPPTHVFPSSVHLLFKYVRELSLPLNETEHYYCRPRMHSVLSKSSTCDSCGSHDIGIFYELPLDNIIKFLFEQRGLADLIDQYSEARSQRGDSENICDITDGSEYKRVWSDISSKYKLTLILNTDGVSPHTSSKARFWPLMFSIMEVPPHLRSSFTIVWGIWFDKKLKPDMNLYLKPFVSSLVKIHEAGGVSWKHPSTGSVHLSPVRAPLIVADAPARAAVLNMQEHQAKYACNTCEQKTSKLPAPPTAPGEKKKRRKRRFTFKEAAATLRSHQRMLQCGNIGTELVPKRGIKGLTVIRNIPFLDLSTCVLAEYMHSVMCGVVRQLCSLWFFEKGPWYIGDHLVEINKFLEQEIHPPSFVSRLPRSFEYFALLKANEFRSFLLYFSLIIVAPYLKDEYHQHWMLFVQAIFLLLKGSISQNDKTAAEALLRLFVRELGTLYGDNQYVYNCHQLLHLVLYVSRWGCLWSNSAFTFENLNGILSDMIHGSKNEGRELLNQLSLAQGNQMLKNKIVINAKKRTGLSVSGKKIPRSLTEGELNQLKKLNSNVKPDCVEFYDRIEVGRETFSSQIYDKNFKRRNSYVEIKCGKRKMYGRIAVFCKFGDSVFCIVSVFKVDQTKFFFHRKTRTRISHIIPVIDCGDIVVCEAKDIVQKLIQVGDFLCFPPNTIERNL